MYVAPASVTTSRKIPVFSLKLPVFALFCEHRRRPKNTLLSLFAKHRYKGRMWMSMRPCGPMTHGSMYVNYVQCDTDITAHCRAETRRFWKHAGLFSTRHKTVTNAVLFRVNHTPCYQMHTSLPQAEPKLAASSTRTVLFHNESGR